MKRLASFILALLFIGSNLGLAMGTHFCGGLAMGAEVLLGHTELSCGMMPELPSHHADHPHDQNIKSIPCCANEFKSLHIEDDFEHVASSILVEQVAIHTPLFVIADFSNIVGEDYSFHAYSPPIRTEAVSILFQVFRI